MQKYYKFIVRTPNLNNPDGILALNPTCIMCDIFQKYPNVVRGKLHCSELENVEIISDDAVYDSQAILNRTIGSNRHVILDIGDKELDLSKYRSHMIDGVIVNIDNWLANAYRYAYDEITLELKKYDLFVVDFDGTIVDTMPMWKDICPNFIRSMNKVPSDDIYLQITSLTNVEIAKFVRDNYLPEYSYEEATELFFNFIKQEYLKQELKPNAIQLLEDMNKCGKVVLYSATAGSVLDVLLDKFNLKQYFMGIYSGSDLKLTKKDGSGYLEVIKLAGGAKRPLILEDAIHAILGAKNVGLEVLAIYDYSNMNRSNVVVENADYYLNLNKYKKMD